MRKNSDGDDVLVGYDLSDLTSRRTERKGCPESLVLSVKES